MDVTKVRDLDWRESFNAVDLEVRAWLPPYVPTVLEQCWRIGAELERVNICHDELVDELKKVFTKDPADRALLDHAIAMMEDVSFLDEDCRCNLVGAKIIRKIQSYAGFKATFRTLATDYAEWFLDIYRPEEEPAKIELAEAALVEEKITLPPVDSEDEQSSESDDEIVESYSHVPYHSENHITTLSLGEVCCGGMPQNRKGRKKGKARTGKRRKAEASQKTAHQSVRIRGMGALVPESVIVDLPFVLEGLITAAGSAGAGLALHLNDSYDVDLALASASTIGFQFYSDAYENFRDLRSRINLDHWNQETFPALFYLLPSTENLSAATAISDRVAGNPFGVSHSLQAKGMYGCQRRLIRSHSVCSVVGSQAPKTADNFGGTTSGSLRVADHVYWNFYVKATGGNVLTATGGIGFRLTMTQTVMFYARKAITS